MCKNTILLQSIMFRIFVLSAIFEASTVSCYGQQQPLKIANESPSSLFQNAMTSINVRCKIIITARDEIGKQIGPISWMQVTRSEFGKSIRYGSSATSEIENIIICNSNYSALIRYNMKSKSYILIEFSSEPHHIYSPICNRSLTNEIQWHLSSKHNFGETISSAVQEPFSFEKLQSVGDIATYRFSSDAKPLKTDSIVLANGEFTIDIAKNNSIVSGHFLRKQGTASVLTEYYNEIVKFDILEWQCVKRHFKSFEIIKGVKKHLRNGQTTFDFDENYAFDKEQFMLSGYDLPEPLNILAPKKPSIFFKVLVIVTVVVSSVLLALFFRRRSLRAKVA